VVRKAPANAAFVDRACGHIDRFVGIMFRTTINRLDTQQVVAEDRLFERLCRVISLTEKRGYRQVETLLNTRSSIRFRAHQDLQHHQAGRAEPLGTL
jgi:hypothetical protein